MKLNYVMDKKQLGGLIHSIQKYQEQEIQSITAIYLKMMNQARQEV